jgi:hypothetical protein
MGWTTNLLARRPVRIVVPISADLPGRVRAETVSDRIIGALIMHNADHGKEGPCAIYVVLLNFTSEAAKTVKEPPDRFVGDKPRLENGGIDSSNSRYTICWK